MRLHEEKSLSSCFSRFSRNLTRLQSFRRDVNHVTNRSKVNIIEDLKINSNISYQIDRLFYLNNCLIPVFILGETFETTLKLNGNTTEDEVKKSCFLLSGELFL